ncbi:hypothetical protein BR93DRAFT_973383 [Coniochaeta sp. PMI_546]|nr:hypothetical protein BR93DRAFT_973383 [Coniochaeta sp. PMI_546]
MSPTLDPTPIRPGCRGYFAGTREDNREDAHVTLAAAANRLNGTTPASNSPSSFASTRQSSTDKIAPPPPRQTHSPSTDPFLRDFTLVAEAAKRAQMAVLVRDLENIGF